MIYTDFETFLIDEGEDRIFRINGLMAKIVEALELPDKEILIGYKIIPTHEYLYDERFAKLPIRYRRLRNIQLDFCPVDMEEKDNVVD